MKLKEGKTGCVYLIRNEDNGLLKIGYTNNLERRLKQIRKSFEFSGINPRLVVEYIFEHDNYVELEGYLHKEFDGCRVQNEWFDIKDIGLIVEKEKAFSPKEKPKAKQQRMAAPCKINRSHMSNNTEAMTVYKELSINTEVLDLINYESENGLEALLVYTAILLHSEMRKGWLPSTRWTTSLSTLFTDFGISLKKEDKAKLVEALQYLVDLNIISVDEMPKGFTKEFIINTDSSMLDKGQSYMLIRADEFSTILSGKLAEVRQELALYIFFISTVNGAYINLSLEELGETLTNKQYNGGDCDSWLVRLKKEEQDELLQVICWWNLEDITTHRHSKDTSGVQWITRPTLNKVLKRLEDKGIISTITVKCKGFANKSVLCKTEHKPLVKSYYENKGIHINT